MAYCEHKRDNKKNLRFRSEDAFVQSVQKIIVLLPIETKSKY